jgi:hypothetical protein
VGDLGNVANAWNCRSALFESAFTARVPVRQVGETRNQRCAELLKLPDSSKHSY